jgi:adenosine kinase
MSIVVTGSIATDHLMTFPGRFRDQLVDSALDRLSLSFLVERLDVFRGGVGANIAFGLGRLGLRPVLVGAVGPDFAEYRAWLERHNVETAHIRVSESKHTARFLCTTDADQLQIASFYPGAMAEAREIDLRQVVGMLERVDLVVIAPDDPAAMLRHATSCRRLSMPFAADPSQQLARMTGAEIAELTEGARFLFTNEYEAELLQQKTGWSRRDILSTVETWVTTRGPEGVVIETRGEAPVHVAAAPPREEAEPTGAGDAFRAGFLAGMSWRVTPQCAAMLGCVMGTLALEAVGTQEYRFEPADVLLRLSEVYGPWTAREIELHLPTSWDEGCLPRDDHDGNPPPSCEPRDA